MLSAAISLQNMLLPSVPQQPWPIADTLGLPRNEPPRNTLLEKLPGTSQAGVANMHRA